MNRILILFILLLNIFLPGNAQIPYNNDIIYRLRSDTLVYTSDTFVTKWQNIIDTSLYLYQNDISKTPLLKFDQQLLCNVIRFDGIDDYMIFSDTLELDTFTIVTIVKPYDQNLRAIIGGNNYDYFRLHTDQKVQWNTSAPSYTINHGGLIKNYNFNIISSWSNSNYYFLAVNDSIIQDSAIFNYPPATITEFARVGPGNSRFYGDFVDFIVYNRILSKTELLNVVYYLRYKYAPPVNLGYDIYIPYGFCDTTLDAGGRFTSYIWNTGDTTQTIQVNRTGYYSVTVTDIFGFESSDTVYVEFPAVEDFHDTTICLYDTIQWITGLDEGIYTVIWNTGDSGNTLNIAQEGYYYCQVYDTNGCSMTVDSIFVGVDSFPARDLFWHTDTALCAGVNLYVENPDAVSYLWYNGDTTSYTIVADSGFYHVECTDTLGCHSVDTLHVNIMGVAPVVDFHWDTHCFGDTVHFTSDAYVQDTSVLTSFLWNIDTLGTAHSDTFSFVFPDTLTYTVGLLVETSNGCVNYTNKPVKIYPLPEVRFNVPNICERASISLNSEIQSSYPVSLLRWYEDGNFISTSQTLTIMYDTLGTHTIKLAAKDINGCINSYDTTIEVIPTPSASFTVNGHCAGESIYFENTTSTLFYNPIVENIWDFGDGTVEESGNATHTYNNTGEYTVQLTVKGVNGCKDSVLNHITINTKPEFTVSDCTLCSNTLDTLYMVPLNNFTPQSYYWEIADTSSTDYPFVISVSDTGIFDLICTVVSDSGCTGTDTTSIRIYPQPDATFVLDSYTPYNDFGITATAIDTTYPCYIWYLCSEYEDCDLSYNNGGTGDYKMVSQVLTGDTAVILIVKNDFGCTDTFMQTFQVIPYQFYPLQIDSLFYTFDNETLKVGTIIKNEGTIPLSGFTLICSADGNRLITETFDDIVVGMYESKRVDFSSGIFLKEEPLNVCVDIYGGMYNDHWDRKCTTHYGNQHPFISVHPIPVVNTLVIEYFDTTGQNATVRIITEDGRTVTEQNVKLNKGYGKINIDVSYLKNGLYLLKVNTTNSEVVKKIIKQ